MWLALNFLPIRAPHASFPLKPEATTLIQQPVRPSAPYYALDRSAAVAALSALNLRRSLAPSA